MATVQRIHVFALARDHADREAAAHRLAIAAEVGLDAEHALHATRMRAESGHHFVEDQQGTRGRGDLAQLAQEVHRLEIGAPALHGFHQDGGEFVRALAQDAQRFLGAVLQHEDVARGLGHDAGCGGHAAQRTRAADDHLVENAVVCACEHRDCAAAGHGPGDAHRAHHRFGAGVAERRALGAGDLAEQARGFAREHVLRADLVALLDPLMQAFAEEIRLPAEQIHAEAIEDVDILVAVEVPHARTARTLHDDLVDELLRERAEAVDHPRVRHVRAMLDGVRLGLRGARRVARDERVQARALQGRQRVALGVDAGDRAEGLAHVVALRRSGFFVVVGRRRCRRGSGRRDRARRFARGGTGGRGFIQPCRQARGGAVLLHYLPERQLHAEHALQLQRQLRQGERIQPQLQPGGVRIGRREFQAGDLFHQREQPRPCIGDLRLGGRIGGLRRRGVDRVVIVLCRHGRGSCRADEACVDPVPLALERIERQGDLEPLLPLAVRPPVRLDARRPQAPECFGDRGRLALGGVGEAGEDHLRGAASGRALARERRQRRARADLQQDACFVLQQACRRRSEAHGRTQVACPVIRIAGLRVRQPVAGDRGHDRDARCVQRDRRQACAHRRDHRIHHRRVERMRCHQSARGDALGRQACLERFDRRCRACDDAQARGVFRGELQRALEIPCDIGNRQANREHAARRLRVHQAAAQRHQPDRVFHRHHAGQRRADEFADAVACECAGNDAPRQPQPCERVFEREQRRLHGFGRGERIRAGIHQACARVATERIRQRRAAGVVGVAEHGFVRIQARAHRGVLRALAREQEGNARAAVRASRLRCRLEARDGIGMVACGDAAAIGKRAAPDALRMRDVGERVLRATARSGVGKERGQPMSRLFQRLWGARGQGQDLLRPRDGRSGRGRRRFLQDDVRIGATEAERTHACAARCIAARPLHRLRGGHEGRRIEIDLGVGRCVSDRRRDLLAMERQRGLDHASGTGGGDEVADIALQRPDRAEAAIFGMPAERAGQALDLDGVANGRGGAVRFDITDGAGVDVGCVVRHRDNGRLAGGIGCGEAGA